MTRKSYFIFGGIGLLFSFYAASLISKSKKKLNLSIENEEAEQGHGADTLQRVGRSVTENAEEAFSAPSLRLLDVPMSSNILWLRQIVKRAAHA